MDIIERMANQSFDRNIEFGYNNYKDALQNLKYDALDIHSKLDKIKFFNLALNRINKKYDEHLPKCTNPKTCQMNIDYESIAYFLRQELSSLGIAIDEDTFTPQEKSEADQKLNKILKDIEELKLGHQIIYDDLLKEIYELKDLHFLGKKKWYQLFAGKFVDMAVSGVVSETVSKQIIETLKPSLSKLIE